MKGLAAFAARSEATFWNGLPCPCRKVTVIVADTGQFPLYWAKGEGIVGQRIEAVEVDRGDHVFYLDDREGHGWDKVTTGHGSPNWRHSSVEVDPDSVEFL